MTIKQPAAFIYGQFTQVFCGLPFLVKKAILYVVQKQKRDY